LAIRTPHSALRNEVTVYSVTITLFDVRGNPFVYGEVVPAAAFADRVIELVDTVDEGRRRHDLAVHERILHYGD